MPSSEILNGAATITTSASQIVAGRQRREAVLIQNAHASNTLYVGSSSSVTTSNGVKVPAGGSVSLETNATVFGIADAAATDVRYLELF